MNPLTEALLLEIAQSCAGYQTTRKINFTELNQLSIENPLVSQDLPSMPGDYYQVEFETPEQATGFRAELGSRGFTNAHVTTNGVAFALVVINEDFENLYQ